MSRYVTVSTFAHHYNLSPRTVRAWCRQGLLPGAWNVANSAHWHIPRELLETFPNTKTANTTASAASAVSAASRSDERNEETIEP